MKPKVKPKLKSPPKVRPALQALHPDATPTPLARTYRDPRTGKEFGTRAEYRYHQAQWSKTVIRDFEELVREKTLGQKAWDQLPGESALAFSRFRAYLAMPLDPINHTRSIKRLAASVRMHEDRMYIHSRKFYWALRSKLYDQNLMEEEEVEFVRERRQAARRQARLGMAMQSAASKGLDHLRQDPIRLQSMSPMEILKMAESGQRVERLARGDSTENTDTEVRVVWAGPQPSWAPQLPTSKPPATKALTDGNTIEGEIVDSSPEVDS